MKYRLKKDLPYLNAGAIYEKKGEFLVNEQGWTLDFSCIKDFNSWFEPLSPQEEVEELTENDFQRANNTWNEPLYYLNEKGRDKLIRIINRRGKGEV